MGIPESQLLTWSNQGAIQTAENTHNSIRTALKYYSKWPVGVEYDPYLQGSYKNHTNIYSNSDVDLVVELTSAYYSNLSEEEKLRMGLRSTNYNLEQFRGDVTAALISYYGSSLVDTSGDKSIKVLPNSGRLIADVVVCCKYKLYENQRERAEGITFWTRSRGIQVINYPKQHFDNGAQKNSYERTGQRYRSSTRLFKNARDKIYEQKPSQKGKFPSYFVECLLYNVPDRCYTTRYDETFCAAVNWLEDKFNSNSVEKFVCQNDLYYLFGSDIVQWNIADAREFVSQLDTLWNSW